MTKPISAKDDMTLVKATVLFICQAWRYSNDLSSIRHRLMTFLLHLVRRWLLTVSYYSSWPRTAFRFFLTWRLSLIGRPEMLIGRPRTINTAFIRRKWKHCILVRRRWFRRRATNNLASLKHVLWAMKVNAECANRMRARADAPIEPMYTDEPMSEPMSGRRWYRPMNRPMRTGTGTDEPVDHFYPYTFELLNFSELFWTFLNF